MNRSPFEPDQVKIALIGGGTGSFTLLSALKNHTNQIAALVNMADDGGSTGQLRDELGVLPPGDVRQCLVALSRTPEVRELFNYRFDEGSLKGHAFGNLFLTALEKMTGDFAQGVELASRILNIVGRVEPITLDDVHLSAKLSDGTQEHSEFKITEMDFHGERPEMWLEPNAKANPVAIAAIEQADIVIIAPGNLYGSLAPALIVDGVGEALQRSEAMKLYVANLVTKPGQTDGYTVDDFAQEVERLAGGSFLDVVLYNTEKPSDQLLDRYAKAGERAVEYGASDHDRSYRLVGAPIVAGTVWEGQASDPIADHRTLIRHDSVAVAQLVMEIYDRMKKRHVIR